jgi:hypothetical protein
MEVTASSPLFEIACLLVRLDDVASSIVNANHSPTFKPPGRCLTRLVPAVVARTACAPCDEFGFTLNTTAAFHVFFWLEVTSYHVPYVLFDSAPSGSN